MHKFLMTAAFAAATLIAAPAIAQDAMGKGDAMHKDTGMMKGDMQKGEMKGEMKGDMKSDHHMMSHHRMMHHRHHRHHHHHKM
ncbi:MAG: hypothetical protein H7241_06050 [Novosphingobium sp.]|nr:hypothetical protein [Novosphingobium sp.]